MEYAQIERIYRLAKAFLKSEPENLKKTLDESVPIIETFCRRCSLWLWVEENGPDDWTCFWYHLQRDSDRTQWFAARTALFSKSEGGVDSELGCLGPYLASEGDSRTRVFIPLKSARQDSGVLEILYEEGNTGTETDLPAFFGELASLFQGILSHNDKTKPDQFDPFYRSLPGMTWETGTDGKYRFVSQQAFELYGYHPEEMVGQQRVFFLDQSRAVYRSDLNRPVNIESHETVSTLIRAKRKGGGGQRLFASASPVFDDSGAWSGYRGIDQIYPKDLSEPATTPSVNQELEHRVVERTQAFQRVIERYKTVQMRLEMVLWAANQGVWDWDLQTNKISHNDNYYTMLGYSKRDFPDPDVVWRQLIHPEDIDRALKAWDEHCSGSKPYYEVEYRMRKKNGEYLWILDKGRIVSYGEDLVPLRMVGIHSDITAQRAFEEELRQAKLVAEAANRSKSEFIANVNHELRTPLTVIMGLAETLFMEVPGEKKDFPRNILKNAKQLLNLINDIIDLSKIESGKFTLVKKPFQLAEALEYIHQSFALETEKKGLYLKIHSLSKEVVGDNVRLKQILTNLIANAIKFTSEGGITKARLPLNSRFRIPASVWLNPNSAKSSNGFIK